MPCEDGDEVFPWIVVVVDGLNSEHSSSLVLQGAPNDLPLFPHQLLEGRILWVVYRMSRREGERPMVMSDAAERA